MTFFSESYSWPSKSIEFRSACEGASDGSADIVERAGRWYLKSPGSFSYTSGKSGTRSLTTCLENTPTFIRGEVAAIEGDLGLRIDELRVGSETPDGSYVKVQAVFEHLSAACAYRLEDRPARSLSQQITFPAVGGASEMSAVFPTDDNTIELTSPTAVPLEEFESQLAVFQALLVLATDLPCGRLSMVATDAANVRVQIFGRDKYAPFGRKKRPAVEHSLRLSGVWLQEVIGEWWNSYEDWKPILQIFSGLRFQPGFVDADVILSSAAIESLASRLKQDVPPRLNADEQRPFIDALNSLTGLNNAQKKMCESLKGELSRRTFRSKVYQLMESVSVDVWQKARISTSDWTKALIRVRNKIAHAAQDEVWDDSQLLRGMRDANWIVLSLLILNHLRVPSEVLSNSADRLGTRYAPRHPSVDIFL